MSNYNFIEQVVMFCSVQFIYSGSVKYYWVSFFYFLGQVENGTILRVHDNHIVVAFFHQGLKYTKNVYKSEIVINHKHESHRDQNRSPLFSLMPYVILFVFVIIFLLGIIYVWYFCAHRPIYLDVHVRA